MNKPGAKHVQRQALNLLMPALMLIMLSPTVLAQPAEDLAVSPPPGGLLLTQPQIEIRSNLGLPQFPDVNINPTPTPPVTQLVTIDEDDADEPVLTLILFALIGCLAVLAACIAMLLTTRREAL